MKFDQFLTAYGNFVARYWQDGDVRRRVESSPAEALEEMGLDVGDANVTLIKDDSQMQVEMLEKYGITPEGNTNEEILHQLWNRGVELGDLRVLIPGPVESEEELGELTDDELMSVAGGEDDSWVNLNVSWGGGDGWVNVGWG